jgi:hypothetical protein
MGLAQPTTRTHVPDAPPAGASRGVLLRRLSIRCPVTGSATDTGLQLTALPQLIGEHVLIDCLECGQDHTWRVEDAFAD